MDEPADPATLAVILPGIVDLPGTPTHPLIPGQVCAYLNKRGSLTWETLGSLTLPEVQAIPYMGPVRTHRLIDAVAEVLALDPAEQDQRLAAAELVGDGGTDELTLGEILPGLADLDRDPDAEVFGGPLHKHLLRQGRCTWAAVAELTVGEMETIPNLGPLRSRRILAQLAALLDVDLDRQLAVATNADAAASAIGEAMLEIAAWAVAGGFTGSTLDAVQLALSSSAPDVPSASVSWLSKLSAADTAPAEQVARYDPVRAAKAFLAWYDDRDRAILDRITAMEGPVRTLQEIGEEFDITRERVRQIEARIRDRLHSITPDPELRPVLAAAERLRERLGAVAPRHLVSGIVGPDADRVQRLTLHLAGPYRIDGDWLVLSSTGRRSDLVRSSFSEVATEGIAPRAAVADRLVERGVRDEFVDQLIEDASHIRAIDDHLVDWSGSLASKAVAVLTLVGRPMLMSEIEELVQPNSPRGMSGQMQADPRIVRVGVRRYALAKWEMDQFPGVMPAMADRLRNGPLAIAALSEELACEYGVSPNSVAIIAGQHPAFLTEGGMVMLRPLIQPYVPEATLAGTRSCYLVDGVWSWRVPVDHDVLRGSGRQLPEAFAVHLGVMPLGSGSIESPVGPIALGWQQYPAVGSLRGAARSIDASEGDWMFIRRVRPSAVDFVLVRATDLPAEPEPRLRALIGAADRPGSLEQVLADALGLRGTVNHDLGEERAALELRKEQPLIDLLDAVIEDRGRAPGA